METTKVLYWADFKKSYSRHLIRKLQEIDPSLEFKILDNITDILHDVDVFDYQIVLIQVTDVSKFSASEDERNRIGETLEDYVDAILAICKNHNVAVIDLFKINPLDPTDQEVVPDGLHPNDKGHEIMAQVIAEELLKI